MDSTIEKFLKGLIERLTDFDINNLTNETTIEELDLVSLDFVTIKVEAKREIGLEIDLNELAEAEIDSFGDMVSYLEALYSKKG
ncbi:phosphopantetheine-binding protein [Pantoea sp.]|uniref:phosphopantetheine-binding protein n=1 Tax=Pantoea sp. TaxID=69393 RepID=UPI0028975665|nr:phosphopantetheine-binding protein [Pantoea sp.]